MSEWSGTLRVPSKTATSFSAARYKLSRGGYPLCSVSMWELLGLRKLSTWFNYLNSWITIRAHFSMKVLNFKTPNIFQIAFMPISPLWRWQIGISISILKRKLKIKACVCEDTRKHEVYNLLHVLVDSFFSMDCAEVLFFRSLTFIIVKIILQGTKTTFKNRKWILTSHQVNIKGY